MLAQDRHRLGEDLNAGARKVELATAVVGQHDTLDAGLDGAKNVLDALDALEDDGHLGDALEPGDVGPAQGRVDEGRYGTRGALGVIRLGALLHVTTRVSELEAHVLLATAQLRRINSDEETLAAAALGGLDDALGDGAVLVDVELQPLDLISLPGVDELVERARGERGDHLDDVVAAGGAGEQDLALWVAELAQRRGGHVEGGVDFGAEHGGGEVDVGDVDEDLGAEPDSVVGAVVLTQSLKGMD